MTHTALISLIILAEIRLVESNIAYLNAARQELLTTLMFHLRMLSLPRLRRSLIRRIYTKHLLTQGCVLRKNYVLMLLMLSKATRMNLSLPRQDLHNPRDLLLIKNLKINRGHGLKVYKALVDYLKQERQAGIEQVTQQDHSQDFRNQGTLLRNPQTGAFVQHNSTAMNSGPAHTHQSYPFGNRRRPSEVGKLFPKD